MCATAREFPGTLAEHREGAGEGPVAAALDAQLLSALAGDGDRGLRVLRRPHAHHDAYGAGLGHGAAGQPLSRAHAARRRRRTQHRLGARRGVKTAAMFAQRRHRRQLRFHSLPIFDAGSPLAARPCTTSASF